MNQTIYDKMAATAPFGRVKSVYYHDERLEVKLKGADASTSLTRQFVHAIQILYEGHVTWGPVKDGYRVRSDKTPIYSITRKQKGNVEIVEIVPEGDGLRTHDTGEVLEAYGSLLEANRPKPRWPAALLGAWLTFMATGFALYLATGETNRVLRDQTQCIIQKTECLNDLLESNRAQLECMEREAASLRSEGTKLQDTVRITKNAAVLTDAARESEEECVEDLVSALRTATEATDNARQCSEQLETTSNKLVSCYQENVKLHRAAAVCGMIQEEPETPEPLFRDKRPGSREPQKRPSVPRMHPEARPTS